MELEYVNCDLCESKSNQTELYLQVKDRQHSLGNSFNLVKCKNCGLIYVNPRPTKEEIPHTYPKEQYYPHEKAFKWDYNKKVSRRYKRLTKNLLATRKKGKLLDLGCGDGYFLKSVNDYGWEAFRVEISPFASAFAREKLGLNVLTGELLDTHYPKKYFDVITLFEVLEHLPGPRETLLEIHKILKDDGLLLITVPNIQSLQTRVFRERCMSLDIPRHLYHFSPETLGHLLEKTGFQIFKLRFSANMEAFLDTVAHILKDVIEKQTHNNNMEPAPTIIKKPKRLKTSFKRKLVGVANFSLWPIGCVLAKYRLSTGMWAYAKKK